LFSTYGSAQPPFAARKVAEMLTHTTHKSYSADPRGESPTPRWKEEKPLGDESESSFERNLQILHSRGADFTRSDVRHGKGTVPLEEKREEVAAAPEETSVCSNAIRVRGPLVEEEEEVVEEEGAGGTGRGREEGGEGACRSAT
jgi:hypothetical protein